MRGLEKHDMGRGEIYRKKDIATTRRNQPRGCFYEKPFNLVVFCVSNASGLLDLWVPGSQDTIIVKL